MINDKRKIILLIMIIVLVLVFVLLAVTQTKTKIQEKNELNSTVEFSEDDLPENTNQVSKLNISSLAFAAYDVINKLQYSAYSKDVMLGILDQEYLDYYNLNESNIDDAMKKYIGKKYEITNIDYAATYDFSMYILFIHCKSGETFIMKYLEASDKYRLFLDNYIEDYGYDKFVSERLKAMLDELAVQGSRYNKLEIVYNPEEFIQKYYTLIYETYDFDSLYNNVLSNDTKEAYSYEQLKNVYEAEDSFFMNPEVYNVTYLPNENGLRKYTFKDSGIREYTLTEDSYFTFKLDIKF